jgi:hypothetical protein
MEKVQYLNWNIMKYVSYYFLGKLFIFIVYAFGIVDVDIILYIVGQSYEVRI